MDDELVGADPEEWAGSVVASEIEPDVWVCVLPGDDPASRNRSSNLRDCKATVAERAPGEVRWRRGPDGSWNAFVVGEAAT